MLKAATILFIPSLSKRAFWDTDMNTLDLDRHARFIIIRVFERGNAKDKEAITQYYGEGRIVATLLEADSLLPVAIESAKKMFHLSDKDFACYTKKPQPLSYSKY